MALKLHTPRWAWALTGSGHFFVESFALIHTLEHVDVFVSRAADEVLRMYKLKLDFPKSVRVMHDKTASSIPVGGFTTASTILWLSRRRVQTPLPNACSASPTRCRQTRSRRPGNAGCRPSSLRATRRQK